MPLSDVTPKTAGTLTLADYTHPALIVPHLREQDTAGIIGELSQALQRHGCVPDMLPFYHAALNQELLASSALECGVAFPHARSGGVKQIQFAFGRAPRPVIWGSKNSWPVQLIFLLAVPATDAARYLHLLATLAWLGRQNDHLSELRSASSNEAILRALEKITMRQG